MNQCKYFNQHTDYAIMTLLIIISVIVGIYTVIAKWKTVFEEI